MSLAVGAGVLDSPAAFLKILMRLWANTYKKRVYSPIIVIDLVLFRRDVEDAVPYRAGCKSPGRRAVPYGLFNSPHSGTAIIHFSFFIIH